MSYAVDHAVGTLAFTLLVVAPLPLGLCVVALREPQPRASGPQTLLALLAVWCVAQALVAHGLGLAHRLSFAGVLAAELALLGAGALGLRRLGSRVPPVGAARLLPGRIGALDRLTLLALALLGLTLVWWSAAMPVVDYDSWAFHMPHMAQWLQSGTFTRMVQEAERPRNSYPYGWEALCTLFLTPFGEDVLVTFPSIVAWVLLGLATYLLARLWQARRTDALACAALLLAIPGIAGPLNSMHVDLPFAALFTAAAYLGALWARTRDSMSLGLAAATLGLAAAVRVSAPAYILFLALWLLGLRARSPLAGGRGRPRPATLAGCAVGTALGSFWYAKNWLERGHPLGGGAPFEGAASAEGSWSYFASQTLLFTVNPLQASSWRALFDRAFGELAVPFVALTVMAALWPLSRLGDRRAVPRDSALPLALLLLGTGAIFWVTPLSANSGIQIRLGLPFLAALAVTAAVGATRARLPPEIPVVLATVSAGSIAAGSRIVYVLVPLLVLLSAWRGRGAVTAGSWKRAAVAVVLFAAFGVLARERRERERRYVYGPFWDYLEQQVDPEEPVAYLLSHRSYLFYGRRLARSVIYAPLADGESVDAWADRLRRQNVAVIGVGPWSGASATDRATLERLTADDGPLVAVAGRGAPGEVSLFRLRPAAETPGKGADRRGSTRFQARSGRMAANQPRSSAWIRARLLVQPPAAVGSAEEARVPPRVDPEESQVAALDRRLLAQLQPMPAGGEAMREPDPLGPGDLVAHQRNPVDEERGRRAAAQQ